MNNTASAVKLSRALTIPLAAPPSSLLTTANFVYTYDFEEGIAFFATSGVKLRGYRTNLIKFSQDRTNQLLLSSYKIMPGLTTMVPVGETMAADASRVVTNSPLSQPLSASCNPLLPPPASLSYLIESLLNGLRRTSHRLVK